MEFIDSHAHLYLPEFEEDRYEVINRAIDKGIKKILLPNIDRFSIIPMLNLCSSFPDHCLPMMGLHPTSVKEDFREQLEIVKSQMADRTFIAIGEIGIDLYWDKTFIQQQCEALSFQIDLARSHALPLVIHCREAFFEIMQVLKDNWNGSKYEGVFHSFSGTPAEAEEVIALGFKLGINGVVTFKNSKLGEVIEHVGLEHFILETDAPYLTPVPHRGKRNESSFLPHIGQKIADIKKVSLETIAEVTTNTTNSLFKLS